MRVFRPSWLRTVARRSLPAGAWYCPTPLKDLVHSGLLPLSAVTGARLPRVTLAAGSSKSRGKTLCPQRWSHLQTIRDHQQQGNGVVRGAVRSRWRACRWWGSWLVGFLHVGATSRGGGGPHPTRPSHGRHRHPRPDPVSPKPIRTSGRLGFRSAIEGTLTALSIWLKRELAALIILGRSEQFLIVFRSPVETAGEPADAAVSGVAWRAEGISQSSLRRSSSRPASVGRRSLRRSSRRGPLTIYPC